jgi:phospholipase C
MPLSEIKNIVILMMENRSFDHLLGYLSLGTGGRADVDGLKDAGDWMQTHANQDTDGTSYAPFANPDPYQLPASFDPPHERENVAANLGTLAGGVYPMDGFVSGIPAAISSNPAIRKLVMGYCNAETAPMSDFLAANFTICDRWYSALPAGTQANRLMAMSGFSTIQVNQTPLPDQTLVYDWLTEHNITWRVYHQGLPFFALMPRCIPAILGLTHFKDFSDFAQDILHTPPDDLPQVIFIEPTYQDAPHLGAATDQHAPAGVAAGEGFILQVYNAVTQSNLFWQSCLFIIDYDEHGGFYDHVSPPLTSTAAPAGQYPTFPSLGVRTPGFVISPFVKAGGVCSQTFDHTSVLKLLGERFNKGSYSTFVDPRQVSSLSAALDFSAPISNPAGAPVLTDYLANVPGPPPATAVVPPTGGPNVLPQAFSDALERLQTQGADANHPKFGQLIDAIQSKRVL